jgi:hypothetical protein
MSKNNQTRRSTMQALELRAEVTADRELRLKLPQDIQYGMVRVIVLYEKEAAQEQAPAQRRFGQFKGQAEISADFDDALPDTFWAGDAP